MLEDDYIVRHLRAIVKMIVNRSDKISVLKEEAVQKKLGGQLIEAKILVDEAIESATNISPNQVSLIPAALLVAMISHDIEIRSLLQMSELMLEKREIHRLLYERRDAQKADLVLELIIEKLETTKMDAAELEIYRSVTRKIYQFKELLG